MQFIYSCQMIMFTVNFNVFCSFLKLNKVNFVSKTEIFLVEDKFLTSSQYMASFRSWRKMLTFIKFKHLQCMVVGVFCNFYGHCGMVTTCNGRCYSHCTCIGQILCLGLWQMLLPIFYVICVADGRPLNLMLQPWC